MVGHQSLIISQARINQVEHPGRGLGKARQDHVSYRPDCLLCSAAGFSTHCQPFRRVMKTLVTP